MDIWKIDDCIKDIRDLDYFYPTTVSTYLNLDLEMVFRRLMELTLDGRLVMKFEWRSNGDSRVIEVDRDINQFEIRGHKEISLDELYPIFKVSSEYKEFLNKKERLDGKL
ncbi:hypothetical protein [Bacillus siamensis]|uniref:hypothetical protein n=1 Tax=Bacillus siamensis TaxID=659243 RepID=UPI0007E9D8C0|nr:hypothetical protein [Bacillus siamensis]